MALVDLGIIGSTRRASAAQMRSYARKLNAAHIATKRAQGIIVAPLTDAELTTIVGAYVARGDHYGIAGDAALAQSLHETAGYTFGNQVSIAQKNPAGLGATNDGAAGGGWPDWPRGIEAHFIHVLAWCNDRRGDKDYRLAAVRQEAAKRGWATSWRSLGGRWAVPGLTYGDAIEKGWQAMLQEPKGGTMALNIIRDLTPYNTSGPRGQQAQAVVWHVAEGGRAGVRSWFHNPASEASTHYLVCKNGDVIQFVDESITPWANGAVGNPRLTNPVVKRMVESGINLNRLTISIETERYTGERLDATTPMGKALAQLTREVMQRHKIPIDDDHIIGHNEIDSVNRPNCPGNLDWDGLLAAVQGGGGATTTPGGTIGAALKDQPQPARPPGYLEAGQADTFLWPEGAGIITDRTVTYFNPDEQAYYRREWHNDTGYTPWEKVG